MPRTARVDVAGYCYHLINRANARFRMFRKDATEKSCQEPFLSQKVNLVPDTFSCANFVTHRRDKDAETYELPVGGVYNFVREWRTYFGEEDN